VRTAGVATLAELGEPGTTTVAGPGAALVRAPGIVIPLEAGVRALATLPVSDLDANPPSVTAWSLAAQLALHLIARERMAHPIGRTRTAPSRGRPHAGATARWGVSLTRTEDADRLARLAAAFPPAAHAVPIDAATGPRVWTPEDLLVEFLDTVADALASEHGD